MNCRYNTVFKSHSIVADRPTRRTGAVHAKYSVSHNMVIDLPMWNNGASLIDLHPHDKFHRNGINFLWTDVYVGKPSATG